MWFLLYVSSLFVYLPYSVSISCGTVGAIKFSYPGKTLSKERRGSCKVKPTTVVLWIVLPQLIFFVNDLMPASVNNTLSFMLTDGRFEIYPGPISLLLPVFPVVLVWYLSGCRRPQLRDFLPTRKAFLITLLIVFCIFPLVLAWYEVSQKSLFANPWRCLHLGLKSFYYNGLWEELHYRFLLIPVLCSYYKEKTAIILTSLLFALAHVDTIMVLLFSRQYEYLYSMGGILLLGIASGYLYCLSKSILPCVVLHGLSSGMTHLVAGVGRLYLLRY